MVRCGVGLAAGLALLAAGCARSTGVLPLGPDTFTVTAQHAPLRGGAVSAQRAALTEAEEFCRAQGQTIQAVQTWAGGSNPLGSTDCAVTFRCVAPAGPAGG